MPKVKFSSQTIKDPRTIGMLFAKEMLLVNLFLLPFGSNQSLSP